MMIVDYGYKPKAEPDLDELRRIEALAQASMTTESTNPHVSISGYQRSSDQILKRAELLRKYLAGEITPMVEGTKLVLKSDSAPDVNEFHDENTLSVVRQTLTGDLGFNEQDATDLIQALQNRGILFRERIRDEPKPSPARGAFGAYQERGLDGS